ncbi:MAG: ferrous iron transport protein A [Alicyclobacillaceae bacterium]|nr:ferrous iron transport protein A [Alicyclobacillaceae bacterium]
MATVAPDGGRAWTDAAREDERTVQTLYLAELREQVSAEVSGLSAHPAFRNRMLTLGITPGSQVVVIRRMPFGGPLEIEVRGTRLAIRQADAAQIAVRVKNGQEQEAAP